VLAYRLRNKLKQLLRGPWRLLKALSFEIELLRARILSRLAPSLYFIEHDRLYPPKDVCKSTADWISKTGRETGAKIVAVDAPCTVLNPLPKTIYDGVRRQFETDQTCRHPETFVVTIPKGRVWGDGYIITPDDQLLDDVTVDFRASGNGRSSVFVYWKLRELAEYDGTVAVLSTDASDLYYHWLFQLLPRLELMKRAGIDLGSIDYFLVNGLKRSFQRETMEILGIDPKRIIESSRVPYLRARELVVPSVPLTGDCFRPWMLQFLRDAFIPKNDEGGMKPSGRRLYISRGQAGYRRVLNEAEVIEFLRRRGFEEIRFENLSIPEQAAAMASCEVVVGPHGGGLSNLVFCSPGAKVIEVFPPELVHGFFWKLSNQIGLDYYYMLGKGHPATRTADYEQSWDHSVDIEIELDVLAKTLDLANVA
jgi:hypothetical protein